MFVSFLLLQFVSRVVVLRCLSRRSFPVRCCSFHQLFHRPLLFDAHVEAPATAWDED